MSLQDVLAFVQENPVCTFATVEGNQPRARGFLTVLFDDGKIYFTTAATKKVYKQISENPNVELCYLSRDFGKMLRITGVIEIVDERKKKQKLLDERDYLKHLNGNAADPVFIMLRLSHGTARFWMLEQNMKEDQIEEITF